MEAREVVGDKDAAELDARREAVEVSDDRGGIFGGVLAHGHHVVLAHVHGVAAVGAVEDQYLGPGARRKRPLHILESPEYMRVRPPM